MLKKILIKGAKEHNLKNISLEIPKEKFVVITGLSGSGKSSLLHLLALLDEPTKGEIILNKQETQHLSSYQKDELRRSSVSIIFQDNNLLTDFTAIENVMMPLIIKGEKTKVIFKKAEQILKNVIFITIFYLFMCYTYMYNVTF